MRINENLALRQIADEYIMIADNGDSLDYTKAISLNSTAAFLIEETGKQEFTAESWVQLLTDNYEVSEDQARADVNALIDTLYEIGIIS